MIKSKKKEPMVYSLSLFDIYKLYFAGLLSRVNNQWVKMFLNAVKLRQILNYYKFRSMLKIEMRWIK